MQKTKLIIIALGVLLLVVIFANINTYNKQKAAERDRDAALQENTTLGEKIKDLEGKYKKSLDELGSKKKDLDKLLTERKDVQDKLNMLEKEITDKDLVIEKLRVQTARGSQEEEKSKAPPRVTSATEESYWAGILKVKTDLELQLSNARNELKSSQINKEQLEREKTNMELDVKNLSRENESLKEQIEYNQKIVDSVTQELVREKNKKLQLEDGSKSVGNENAILRRQLKSLSDRKVELEKEIAELQEKNKTIEASLLKMETLLREKLLQVDDIRREIEPARKDAPLAQEAVNANKGAVELPPIVVRPQPSAAEGASFVAENSSQKAEVLLINRENNFVIINLGEDTGIKVGDTLQVLRENKPIGAIEAIQIRKSFSACDIKREDSPIKIGDRIR